MLGARITSYSGTSSEDEYAGALARGEAQFRKINFLIDIDVLKECKKTLLEYQEEEFTRKRKYTVRVACFLKKTNAIIRYADDVRKRLPNGKKHFSIAKANVADLPFLPADVWNVIIHHLDSNRYITRSVSKFFKECVDSSTTSAILLPYNIVFDVGGCCNIHSVSFIQSNILIQKISGAFKPGIDIFGNKKACFINVLENAFGRPTLK
jgi:hypothetical protein